MNIQKNELSNLQQSAVNYFLLGENVFISGGSTFICDRGVLFFWHEGNGRLFNSRFNWWSFTRSR